MTQNGLQFATLRRWAHRSWPPSAPPTSTTSRRPTRRRPTCSARSTTSSTNRPSPWWPSRSVPPSLSLSLSLCLSLSHMRSLFHTFNVSGFNPFRAALNCFSHCFNSLTDEKQQIYKLAARHSVPRCELVYLLFFNS